MATLPPTPDWKALVETALIRALISPHTSPNGLRISGERGGEADERVRCMRVLGSRPSVPIPVEFISLMVPIQNEGIASVASDLDDFRGR